MKTNSGNQFVDELSKEIRASLEGLVGAPDRLLAALTRFERAVARFEAIVERLEQPAARSWLTRQVDRVRGQA